MEKNYLNKYENECESLARPEVIDHFLGLCFFIAERSEDPQTQHGCVLTNTYNHIVGTGYNAFSRGLPFGAAPNTRPNKYKRIIHSEDNALQNTTMDILSIPGGAICYVTAKPCLRCLDLLNNKGIKTIYYADTSYHFQGWESEAEDFEFSAKHWGIKVLAVKPKVEWIDRPYQRLKAINQ